MTELEYLDELHRKATEDYRFAAELLHAQAKRMTDFIAAVRALEKARHWIDSCDSTSWGPIDEIDAALAPFMKEHGE